MSQDTSEMHGAIVGFLIEDAAVTQEQIRYASRIRSKLANPGPLLAVLKDTGCVDDEQVQSALTRHRMEVPIGDMLVELGHLEADELRMALEIQKSDPARKKKLGHILVEHHFVEDRKLAEILACQLGFEFVEPNVAEIDPKLIARANASWMIQNELLPIRIDGDTTVIAFADPTNATHLEAAAGVWGKRIRAAIAPQVALHGTLSALDPRGRPGVDLEADDSTVTEIVERILTRAVAEGASDIHVEPLSDRLRIRFRVDGVLVIHKEIRLELSRAIAMRIKVLCEADVAERRRHQDARLFFRVGGQELDMRVSIYVTVHGEKIVLRLLNRNRQIAPLAEIGMAPHVLTRFLDDALSRPSGVLMITGPTGSGKTSTLYSCVHHITNPETSIITAEDPVEYVVDGIAQCSIDPSIDRDFDSTLKQIVRQDPDVIVIGEIRDAFSAQTAIQAALTGHKVLTTFHTEDSIGGLMRLLNMNIEAFLISSTVISVVAQRLLRRVCRECASEYRPTPQDLRRLGYFGNDLDAARFVSGRGCDACRHTGYAGRLAIFELLVMDETVREAILNRKTSQEIRRLARESSHVVSLFEDGIHKAAKGWTTIHEVIRMLPRLDKPRPLNELSRLLGA